MDQIITRNPAHPDEIVSRVQPLGAAEIEAGLDAATDSVRSWAEDAGRRAHALERWADRVAASTTLATLITREVGKPIREAQAEVVRAAAILRYYAQAAYGPIGEVLPGGTTGSEVHVRIAPLGVVLAITPWNFPLAIPAWKLGPALAFGNAVILKPASAALGCASAFIALSRPEVPEAVLALAALRTADVDAVLRDARVRGITFTGSTVVGAGVTRIGSERGIPVQAEMGGFNSAIVLDDANLDEVTPMLLGGAMGYAGQKCTATRRVIAGRSIMEELTHRLATAVETISVGDPRSPEVIVGPLIDRESAATFAERIREAENAGALVVAQGTSPPPSGWFVAPTLLSVDSGNVFLDHETFGPALAIQIADSIDDAVAAANATRYGLCAAVHGSDLTRALAIASRLDVGMVRVNAPTTGVDFWAPFGGEKESSFGPREQGTAAREFFTTTRTVTLPRAAT